MMMKEPPKTYTLALAKLRAASGLPVATGRRCTCRDGIVQPWSAAIEARRAAAAVPPVNSLSRRSGEVPKPWSETLQRQRAAEGR